MLEVEICSGETDEEVTLADFAHPSPSRREGLSARRLSTLGRALAAACYFERRVAEGGEWCCRCGGLCASGE